VIDRGDDDLDFTVTGDVTQSAVVHSFKDATRGPLDNADVESARGTRRGDIVRSTRSGSETWRRESEGWSEY